MPESTPPEKPLTGKRKEALRKLWSLRVKERQKLAQAELKRRQEKRQKG